MANVRSLHKPFKILRLAQLIVALSSSTRFVTNAKVIIANARLWKKNGFCITRKPAVSFTNNPPTANIPHRPACVNMKFEQLSDVMCGFVRQIHQAIAKSARPICWVCPIPSSFTSSCGTSIKEKYEPGAKKP